MSFCAGVMSKFCTAEFGLLLRVSKANKFPRLEKKELILLPLINRNSVVSLTWGFRLVSLK